MQLSCSFLFSMNFIRFVRRSFARSLICHNKSVARSGDYATNNAEFVTKKVNFVEWRFSIAIRGQFRFNSHSRWISPTHHSGCNRMMHQACTVQNPKSYFVRETFTYVKVEGIDVVFRLCKLLSYFLTSKLQRKLLTNLITSVLLYLIKTKSAERHAF